MHMICWGGRTWYPVHGTWYSLHLELCLSTVLVLLPYLSVCLQHKLDVHLFAAFSSTQCVFFFIKKAYMPFKNTHPKILECWHVEAGRPSSALNWASKESEKSLIGVKITYSVCKKESNSVTISVSSKLPESCSHLHVDTFLQATQVPPTDTLRSQETQRDLY